MHVKSFYFITLISVWMVQGCSNNSTDVLESKLIDSAVSGVGYKCVGYEGITGSFGEFEYDKDCGEITFFIGSVVLDSILPSSISDDNKLYISELVGLERNVTSDPKVVRILQFLQSLDTNNNPSDGIEISNEHRIALENKEINFADDNLTQSQMRELLLITGDTLVTEEEAVRHYEETLSREENIVVPSSNNTEIRDTEVPTFQTKVSFSVYEDKLSITKVTAIDNNSSVTYSIASGHDANYFKITENNGSLTFIDYVNYEEGKTEFIVNIVAVDASGNRAEKLFNVELLNIDDTPLFSEHSLKEESYFTTQSLNLSSHISTEKLYYRFGDDVFQLFDENLSLVVGEDYNLSYYAEDSEGNKGEVKNSFYRVWATVDSAGGGEYASLFDAVSNQAHRIWIKNGTHTDPRTIEIKYADVIVQGESRDGAIIQKSGAASLLIIQNTHHVIVENLTLDANTYDTDENEIWEAIGIFNSHNITLRGSKILGANTNDTTSFSVNKQDKFAIYFAGPTVPNGLDVGEYLLDRFENGELDENNTIENNLIISDIRGDALSFSLQRYGKVSNNHLIGSVLAFFINRDSNCSNNLIENSSLVSIYVSLPARDNLIDANIIKNSRASGIRVAIQSDYKDSNDINRVPSTHRSTGNRIKNNKIYDTRHMGIEVSNLKGSLIAGNYIEHTDYNGIHLNTIDDMNISNNVLVQGGQAHKPNTCKCI